jgi:ketosteroid isomerase-like protein
MHDRGGEPQHALLHAVQDGEVELRLCGRYGDAPESTSARATVTLRAMDATNTELIERFYAAFARRDGDAMAACYAPDATFRDPVFGQLDAAETAAMWRMLVGRAPDLKVELAEHDADATQGTARWIAHYTFSRTGRPVVNDVRAKFAFRDGLIVEHVERFNFWRWARQALGPIGLFMGWSPGLRLRVHREARAGLARAMQEGNGAMPSRPQDGNQ